MLLLGAATAVTFYGRDDYAITRVTVRMCIHVYIMSLSGELVCTTNESPSISGNCTRIMIMMLSMS